MTTAEILPQIFNLSDDEQLRIVEAIRTHLGAKLSPIDRDIFDAELQRRASDADEHPEDGAPLDLVIERLKEETLSVEIEVRKLAEAELAEAAAWYELRRIGLGNDFLEAFQAQMKTVAHAPLRWPVQVRDIRRYAMRQFPYFSYYDIRGEKIRVLRVVHKSRNPEPIRELFE